MATQKITINGIQYKVVKKCLNPYNFTGISYSKKDNMFLANNPNLPQQKFFKTIEEAKEQRLAWEKEGGWIRITDDQKNQLRKKRKQKDDFKYRIKNKSKIRLINKNRERLLYKNNIKFKLTSCLRARINVALKSKNHKKNTKTTELLGCSYIEFRIHIEKQWESWMNWDNYGAYDLSGHRTWNIDHITPLSSANNEEELLKLFHYTNCRPLCSQANLEKGAKFLY